MTKTELTLIRAAASGNQIFLDTNMKKTLLRLMWEMPVLKVIKTTAFNTLLQVKFDSTIYMGKEPKEYLSIEDIQKLKV